MRGIISGVSQIAAALAWIVAIAVPVWFLITTMGGKFDLWEPLDSFRHIRSYAEYAIYAALGIGGVALIVLVISRLMGGQAGLSGFLGAVLALAVGIAGTMAGNSVSSTAQAVPPIHDISTDLADPPQFSQAMVERRAQDGATNSVDLLSKQVPDADWTGQWGGRPVTEVQAEAYPDIESIGLSAAPQTVFHAALDVGRNMGWRVTSSSQDAMMFEGTAETFWIGFKDDVVVRVRPYEGEDAAIATVLDIRSVSRVGVSDLGANAERIREFETRLRNSLGEPEPS